MRSPIRDDEGSALLLMTFLAVALVMAIAVVVDVGAVLAQRRSLAASADTAALAGAQAIDLAAYYSSVPTDVGSLELDPDRVRSAVHEQLEISGARERHPGLRVESVSVSEREVIVRLRARASLPMVSVFGIESAPVRAGSGARLVVRP